MAGDKPENGDKFFLILKTMCYVFSFARNPVDILRKERDFDYPGNRSK